MDRKLIAECAVPGQYPVRLEEQDCAPRYVVTYGLQLRTFYDFPDARAEFEWSVEHAMRCNGYGD